MGILIKQGSRAKVDAIKDEALSLGWTEDGLCNEKYKTNFPCGNYGLVCFLDANERIGNVTREYIEIILPSSAQQRFYNKDIDQPWNKKSEGENAKETRN